MTTDQCFDCGLPDPYDGAGDGIGSCDCRRCEVCGWAPGVCSCEEYDPYEDEYEPVARRPVETVELPAGDVR